MSKSLMFQSSTIFDDSNLIDQIRQTYIDLDANPMAEEVQYFLESAQEYLDKDLDIKTADELFSVISSCFTYFPKELLPNLAQFLKNSRLNSNYIFLIPLIISELTQKNQQLDIPDYHDFVDDSLKEILPQINNEELILFNHKIPKQFKTSLILNLLLIANITDQLIFDYFPYFLSKSLKPVTLRYKMLMQKFLNLHFNKILPQTAESRRELIQFIKTQDFSLFKNFSKPSRSVLECSLICLKARDRADLEIESIPKESVFPFIAVILIFINELSDCLVPDLAKLIREALPLIESQKGEETKEKIERNEEKIERNEEKIESNEEKIERNEEKIESNDNFEFDLLKESTNYILNHVSNIYEYDLIPTDVLIDLVSVCLSKLAKNEIVCGKIPLFSSIFYLSRQFDDNESVKKFFNSRGNDVVACVIGSMSELNASGAFEGNKLNLCSVDVSLLIDHLQGSSTVDEATQTIHFIEKLSDCGLKLEIGEDFSVTLTLFVNELIQERKWDDVLLIGLFMKKSGCYDELVELKDEEMPSFVKETLFGYIPSEQESLDELLDHLLVDSEMSKKGRAMEIIFKKMVRNDHSLLQTYVSFMISRFHDSSLKLAVHLAVFHRMLRLYPSELSQATSDLFYFNGSEDILFKKPSARLSSLPVSDSSLSIVAKLFRSIEETRKSNRPLNYQAFFILRTIGGAFPFLFAKDPQKVIDIVCPTLENYTLVFNKSPTEAQLAEIKTIYAAFSFFVSTLQSSVVLDHFFGWFMQNMLSLNDTLALAFIIILRIATGDSDVMKYAHAWIRKTRFLDSLGTFLKRTESCQMKFYFRLNILFLIEEIYRSLQSMARFELVRCEELITVEKPFQTVFETVYSTFPSLFMFVKIKFDVFCPSLLEFIREVDFVREFYLCFDIKNETAVSPSDYMYAMFKSDLVSSDSVSKDFIPETDFILTAEMIKYVMMQPILISDIIVKDEKITLVPELYEILLNAVEKVEEMRMSDPSVSPVEQNRRNEEFMSGIKARHYDQKTLYDSLFSQCIDASLIKQNVGIITNILKVISVEELPSISLLSSFSESLKKLHSNNIENETSTFFTGIVQFYGIVNELFDSPNIRRNFMFTLGDELLDVCLSPRYRNSHYIVFVTGITMDIIRDIPIRSIQLIPLLLKFVNDEEDDDKHIAMVLTDLVTKFDEKQLELVRPFIVNYFDKETQNGDISKFLTSLIDQFPKLINDRTFNLTNILSNLLDRLDAKDISKIDVENDEDLEKIFVIFRVVAPRRDQSMSLSTVVENETSIVPQFISCSSPSFWKLYERHIGKIEALLEKDPLLLEKLDFLLSYPELISFSVRSMYFRKKVKRRLDLQRRLELQVDSNNLLKSSYEGLKNRSKDELLSQFNVIFDGGKTVDHGGPTCDWFNKLSKEIFTPKSTYFEFFNETMCFQPSSLSVKNDGYLDFFRFVGQFVARALIEGVCIDAHFSSSFLKMILHRAPKLSDLQSIDQSIYDNLVWLLGNDVDALDFRFEAYDEATHEVVPLVENGSKVAVTNENKKEYVELASKFRMKGKIEEQIGRFVDGFNSLIPHSEVRIFTPNELDLLICGVPQFDVEDFINHTVVKSPYTRDSPVVQFFFSTIRKWSNELRVSLLQFVTGCSRVTSNGFEEFCQITGGPIIINSGGEREKLPQSHTCVNTLSIPQYESEKELAWKLKMAIENCDTFEII